MELQLDNGEYQVVFKDSNLSVEVTESAPLNVVIGESARIEVGEAINYIKAGQAEIEEVVQEGIASFDLNAGNRLSEYNSNADNKLEAYNNNAVSKTNNFNTNATDKTTAFNNNASDKTTAFNNNATAKTGDFDTNATNKTNDFNSNYTEKKGLIDAEVLVAQGAAADAKQWAIGDPSEPTGNSAKYWAEQAESELTGLTSRVSTIEGEIPSAASSSNQLADKNYVLSVLPTVNNATLTIQKNGTDVQTFTANASSDMTANITVPTKTSDLDNDTGYITGITSSDVTTALGYTPYNSTNPNGYTSNVGTVTSVNNASPDGSGNVSITVGDTLPSQTGHSGKFLTTDGTSTSWGTPTASAAWGSITGTLSDQTDLNNALSDKADIDLSNVNSAGKSTGAGWALPSNTYDELTFGASEATYRAPANGWFTAGRKNTSTSSNYLNIINTSSGLSLSFVSDSIRNAEKKVFLPVRKNDVVQIGYGSNSSSLYLRFIYAEGENV